MTKKARRNVLKCSGTALAALGSTAILSSNAAADHDYYVKMSETWGKTTDWQVITDSGDQYNGTLNDDSTKVYYDNDIVYIRANDGKGSITFSCSADEYDNGSPTYDMEVTQYNGTGYYYAQVHEDIGDYDQGSPDDQGETWAEAEIDSSNDHVVKFQHGRLIAGILRPYGSDIWVDRLER